MKLMKPMKEDGMEEGVGKPWQFMYFIPFMSSCWNF
jgi:hypothetical protein